MLEGDSPVWLTTVLRRALGFLRLHSRENRFGGADGSKSIPRGSAHLKRQVMCTSRGGYNLHHSTIPMDVLELAAYATPEDADSTYNEPPDCWTVALQTEIPLHADHFLSPRNRRSASTPRLLDSGLTDKNTTTSRPLSLPSQ